MVLPATQDFDDEVSNWISTNTVPPGKYVRLYGLPLNTDQDLIIAKRLAKASITDKKSTFTIDGYFDEKLYVQIVKYYRHPVYFMQAQSLQPWNQDERLEAVKLAKRLMSDKSQYPWNSTDTTGNSTLWFSKMLTTTTLVTWDDILRLGNDIKGLYHYLPPDVDLAAKLREHYTMLQIRFCGSDNWEFSSNMFWTDKLFTSKMAPTYEEFLKGDKVLNRFVELTWGEVLLFGEDAGECLMPLFRKIANNENLNRKLDDYQD